VSTSVKLAEDDKEKLEKLQALVTLKLGGKMTQQELLARLIQDALTKIDEFIESVKPSVPMGDEEFGRVLSLSEDWGVETRSDEIDKILYGGDRRKASK
jgi:hypothetical protein